MCRRTDAYGRPVLPQSLPDLLSLQIVVLGKGLSFFCRPALCRRRPGKGTVGRRALRLSGRGCGSCLPGGRHFARANCRLWRSSFFGRWWCAQPADDCIQAWPELAFQFCRQLGFDPAGLTDHRPVDTAIQKRGRFPIDDQTGQIRPYILQHPPGCDWSYAKLAELGYFSLKMS